MAERGSGVKPLVVTATMRRELEWERPVALDGLLAGVVARNQGMQPPRVLSEVVDIEIPIKRAPCGRFHLASNACAQGLLFSREQYVHKRAPHEWYAVLCGDKVKRVDISKEPDKSWRVCKVGYRYQRVQWWCLGEADAIKHLLLGVTRLGARRRHGCGEIEQWTVELSSTWEGFPVLRDGAPLRNLPLDYPGLSAGFQQRVSRLTFPYFLKEGTEMLSCPSQ